MISTMTQTILEGDVRLHLASIPDNSVRCCITSPPYYGLRDYGIDEQIGLEPTLPEYIDNLVGVFREVRRVLTPDGTLWLNIGDSYAGSGRGPEGNLGKSTQARHIDHRHQEKVPAGMKPKDLIGVPWMLATALRADGWYLRSEIIWAKATSGQRDYLTRVASTAAAVGIPPEQVAQLIAELDLPVGTSMPESVKDRPTRAHEQIFLLSKSSSYFYNHHAVTEPSVQGGVRHRRDVWAINTSTYKGAHFATFPEELVRVCLMAGSDAGDTILDPFLGSGTTMKVAGDHARSCIGIELNPEYAQLCRKRCAKNLSLFP
jgi:site-specific DNA-methyltransferase (cytosine-N4-specific)